MLRGGPLELSRASAPRSAATSRQAVITPTDGRDIVAPPFCRILRRVSFLLRIGPREMLQSHHEQERTSRRRIPRLFLRLPQRDEDGGRRRAQRKIAPADLTLSGSERLSRDEYRPVRPRQALRRRGGRGPRLPRGERRRVLRAPRGERERQEHDPEDDRGAGTSG